MQSVYVRLTLYVLSTIFAMVPIGLTGYGIHVDAEALKVTIDLPALVTAVFTGFAMSAGILRRWGVQ